MTITTRNRPAVDSCYLSPSLPQFFLTNLKAPFSSRTDVRISNAEFLCVFCLGQTFHLVAVRAQWFNSKRGRTVSLTEGLINSLISDVVSNSLGAADLSLYF